MSKELKMFKLFLFCALATSFVGGDQKVVDYLSQYLKITFSVIDNFADEWRSFKGELRLTNEGAEHFTSKDWELYFSSIRVFEHETIYPNGTELGDSGLSVHHINGYLHKIVPNGKFAGLHPMTPLSVPFKARHWIVSKTDVMPNWYVTSSSDAETKVVVSTQGESLRFVSDFDNKNKWKRQPDDQYDPFTPEMRLEINRADNWKMAPHKVIPTPAEEAYDEERKFTIDSSWVIVKETDDLENEAKYLADRIKLRVVNRASAPTSKYISLEVGMVIGSYAVPIDNPESYSLSLGDDENQNIILTGHGVDAVFYGIQTLLSLNEDPTGIPFGYVVDFPRFPYRGMHMDVARNFHAKKDILRHLEAMGMYKLNKFHFHLTDDEGWRLEIPELPELTEVGGRRCHDLDEDTCLIPQLGSEPNLPNTGSGFYTQADYKEILQFAHERHIEVIPEFDMPGHGRAAIVSMLARYKRYKDSDPAKASEFLLSDLDDKSEYRSIQEFDDNAINPCIESTYKFVKTVIRGVVKLHQEIQPLRVFNFGGDEVPEDAWMESPACHQLMEEREDLGNSSALKREFVTRVAVLAHEEGLDLAGWEDGLMEDREAYNVSALPNTNVYAYYWDNVWEWGRGARAYVGANAGLRTIISHSTHLYFDFPYEPDPEERGFYWATRVTDTRKVFGFAPDNIYENIDVDRMGNQLDIDEVCDEFGCEDVEEEKLMNIMGIQGQLWSETVRTSEQLDYMVFPRLLALAQRAWHVDSWERIDVGMMRDSLRQQAWEKFANTLGYKELARLDKLGIAYHIPPPGAKVFPNNELIVGCAYPGLTIEYSVDGGSTWSEHQQGQTVIPGVTINLRTRSADGKRTSRVVMLGVNTTATIDDLVTLAPGISITPSSAITTHQQISFTAVFIILLVIFMMK